MKRFILDFMIAFLIIVGVFGMIGATENNITDENYNEEVKDENNNIENIKDYDGNLVNRISFKLNNLIQSVADYGFDKFKQLIVSILE